jgi:hypothetical protein
MVGRRLASNSVEMLLHAGRQALREAREVLRDRAGRAQHNLGAMYANGQGVPQDKSKVVAQFSKELDPASKLLEEFRKQQQERYQEMRREQEEAVRRAQEQLELQRAEARRQQSDLEDRARAGGYQSISVEAFVLDGKDLATSAAKVSLRGVYIRQGNLDVLYANVQAAMIANSRGLHQPNVPLLTDHASREFRLHLLKCQSNPASAEMGCPVTVLGRVITCKLSNAYGATREEPCVAVEDGRQ